MSEAPRRINTERSLNRPTEKRPAEAPASKTSLNGQPDFFQPEEPAAPQELPKAKARQEPDTRQELRGWGRNLNQLTVLAHTCRVQTVYLRECMEVLGKTYEAVNRLLTEKGGVISHGDV